MNNHSTAVVEVEGSVEYALDDQLESNLEIVAPTPARVTFMEEDADGNDVPRIAEIKTYVPVFIFNEMLRDRQRMIKDVRRKKLAILRSEENDGSPEVKEMLQEEAKELEQSMMGEWVQEQVFKVWKRTEKNMTLDAFQRGLNFEQIQELFTRFFGGLMRSKQVKDKLRQQG
jgi:hypothetical protein